MLWVGILGGLLFVLCAQKLPAAHADASSFCRAADSQFIRSEFSKAEEAYRAALSIDPLQARAHWGLGRIDLMQLRRKSARDRFSTAYRLSPLDPDIILSYADFVPDPATRAILLKNFIAVAPPSDVRLEDVMARLRIDRNLGDRMPGVLVSPYQPYRLKLGGFYPAGQSPSGWILPVRINGGKPLRLVFDTGAKGIMVAERLVRDLNLEILAASGIGGMGGSATRAAYVALAHTVSTGGLALRNCLINVTDVKLIDGADGVIGGNVFEQFVLRLDARARTLDLIPFDHEPPVLRDRNGESEPDGSVQAYRLGHLLLLPVAVNGASERMFVLDTGSAYTAVSKKMVPRPVAGEARSVALTGARGEIREAFRAPATPLGLAGRKWEDPSLVAFDLSEVSRSEGVEISGMLGYSLLSRSVLTINYREGTVKIAGR